MGYLLIACYLAAIVAANLLVGAYGPPALFVTAWVLIPFDMTAKDALQERWEGSYLPLRMGTLILAGSVLSATVSPASSSIALASFVAFATSSTVDAIVFAVANKAPRLARVNASNLGGALTDSAIFQVIAFGGFDLSVFASQALAKTIGGAVWSVVLDRTVWRWMEGSRLRRSA